jgi:hypothetical protein
MPRAYVPSGKSDSGALPIVLGATLAAAIGGGLVEGFLAQWFNLLVIFPMVLGLLVGGVGMTLVQSRNVRNPLVVAVIGFTMGLAAQAVVHGMAYQRARSTIAAALELDPNVADFVRQNGIDRAVDTALSGEDGAAPLVGYLRLAAKSGVTITRAGSSGSSSPTLTGVGTYTLWALEFLAVAGIAAWMMGSHAREPFCERCNAWYLTEEVVASGAGDRGAVKALVQRLKDGRLVEAVREQGPSDGKSATILVFRGCATCKDHEPLLEVRRVTGIGAKQETKNVHSALLTQSEAEELRAARVAAERAAA